MIDRLTGGNRVEVDWKIPNQQVITSKYFDFFKFKSSDWLVPGSSKSEKSSTASVFKIYLQLSFLVFVTFFNLSTVFSDMIKTLFQTN